MGQRIWAIYARKEDSFVLIAIDWVTRRFMVASIWSFVVWSVRTDLLLHCIIPTKGSYRLNVQSGQPKLKTNWGDRVVIP